MNFKRENSINYELYRHGKLSSCPPYNLIKKLSVMLMELETLEEKLSRGLCYPTRCSLGTTQK